MILHNRKSIRLKGYDYSSSGAYFVTICTQNREMLFGVVGVDPRVDPNLKPRVDPNQKGRTHGSAPTICMKLNNVGEMINGWWLKIPNKFINVELGTFQIMPNHIHGTIFINVGVDPRVDPSLGTIIQWFKTMTTNNYIENVKNSNWAPFNKRIWQRNYYEHIIRNNIEMEKISRYIIENPQMWPARNASHSDAGGDRDRNNPSSSRSRNTLKVV